MSGRLSPIRTRAFLTLYVEAVYGSVFAYNAAGHRFYGSDDAYDSGGFRLTLFM